jgi:peptidase inhibitor family I36
LRSKLAIAAAMIIGLSSVLMAPTAASAAKSQCTSSYALCFWSGTNYTGTWIAYGSLSDGCYGLGSGFRSVWNREVPGALLYMHDGAHCDGLAARFDPGEFSNNFGFLAKTFSLTTY